MRATSSYTPMGADVGPANYCDRMRARAAVPLIAVLAVTLSACGSAIAPRTWATTVCQALSPWRAQIATLNQTAKTEMATAHTPADTRTHLLALLDGGEKASEKARAAVQAAGVPDVDGGAVIEKRFVAALAAVRDAYKKAETTVAALPTDDSDRFYDGVGTAMTTLNTDYANSGVDTSQLASAELQTDFDQVAACR
jgi:hypothetical protein